MRKFLISYNPAAIQPYAQQFAAFISSNRLFEGWAQPFPGLYLVKSRSDNHAIQQSIQTFMPIGLAFIVSETNNSIASGVLSAEIWSWFNQDDFSYLLSAPSKP